MKLIIEDDEGRKTVIPLVREEISIGRLEGNTIRLTERNVSRRHARLFKHSGAILIEDLGSSNGVRINGERIVEQRKVHDGDLIEIGDYDLAIEGLPRSDISTTPSLRLPLSEGDTEVTVPPNGERDVPRELGAGQMPHLVGLAGALWAEELPLTHTVVSFGRAADINDLAIDDPSVSRSHGKFKLEGGAWHVYDSQSSFGVRVNGESVRSSAVKPGDTIEIGEARFRFCAPGEDFTPPREYGATQVVRLEGKSKTPLFAAAGAAFAVLVLGGVWLAMHSGTTPKSTTDTGVENHCQKGKAAYDEKNWADAVQSLSVAKQLGTPCPFALDDLLKEAQANQEVKHALDEADGLIQHNQFKQVIDSLNHVPATSPYADAAKAKVFETKVAAVKQLSMDAQNAIDKGHVEEASTVITDLQAVDPDAATLPFLQKQLTEKKEFILKNAGQPKPGAAAGTDKPSAPNPLPAPPTVQTLEDRTKLAKQAISDGIDLMKAGNFPAGEKKLQEAIKMAPDADTQALAHKNLGVGYAHMKKTDEAIDHLKIYLKLKPNAPDRDRYLAIIKQIEGQH